VQAYLVRDASLTRAAAAYFETEDFGIDQYVNWLIEEKRPALAASSWRQIRASAREGLLALIRAHPELDAVVRIEIERLDEARPAPLPAMIPPRTSALKSKKLPDLDRLCARVASSRSPNARHLVWFLKASAIAGLRPSEWQTAKLQPADASDVSTGVYTWRLVVRNCKTTNGRSTGETRTLYWTSLTATEVRAIRETIAEASRQKSLGTFLTWLSTLSRLLYVQSRALFPRRRSSHPTLSSGRHEAAARWKAHYIERANTPEERERGRAIVAALMGHISDETASRHYGRVAGGSGRMPIAHAAESEVLLVRKIMAARLEKLASLHGASRRHELTHSHC